MSTTLHAVFAADAHLTDVTPLLRLTSGQLLSEVMSL
jgi:hypothetical protein